MLVCIHETLHMCIYKVLYMCVCIYSYKTLLYVCVFQEKVSWFAEGVELRVLMDTANACIYIIT